MSLSRRTGNLLVVVLLAFAAMAMLMAALDYSSGIVNSGSGSQVDLFSSGTGNGNSPHEGTDNGASSEAETDSKKKNGLDLLEVLGVESGGSGSAASSQDSGKMLAIAAAIAVALAAVSAIAYVIIRRRRARAAAKPEDVPAEAVNTASESPAVSFEGRYRLRFPQIGALFPIVWGAGEPLELAIESKDGAGGEVSVSVDGVETRTALLERGKAAVILSIGKGRHRITVGARGCAISAEESWADVRIVDYREETVRLFNSLYARLKSGGSEAGDTMTPRELACAARGHLPEAHGKMLDGAVAIFECANYSLHAVGRQDYERMYLSERAMT